MKIIIKELFGSIFDILRNVFSIKLPFSKGDANDALVSKTDRLEVDTKFHPLC